MQLRNRADGRVHFSDLAMMRYSPAHYGHAVTNPKEQTRGMTVGALADAMVLGGRGWALYEGKTRRGKEWDAFEREHAGDVIGIASEVDEAKEIAVAVLADEAAQSLLTLPGMAYQTCHKWSAFGLECSCGVPGERGGIDAISIAKRVLVDMKVTVSADPGKLMRHAYDRMWHAQLAWYLEAVGRGIAPDYHGIGTRDIVPEMWSTYLICAEATAPHCVTVLRVPELLLRDGRKSLTLWAEKLRACEESGRWPGYTDSIVEMQRPVWIDDLDDEDDK